MRIIHPITNCKWHQLLLMRKLTNNSRFDYIDVEPFDAVKDPVWTEATRSLRVVVIIVGVLLWLLVLHLLELKSHIRVFRNDLLRTLLFSCFK